MSKDWNCFIRLSDIETIDIKKMKWKSTWERKIDHDEIIRVRENHDVIIRARENHRVVNSFEKNRWRTRKFLQYQHLTTSFQSINDYYLFYDTLLFIFMIWRFCAENHLLSFTMKRIKFHDKSINWN